VLLDPESFGGSEGTKQPIDELLAGNVLTYVVPAESDISLMLGPAGLAGEATPERQKVAVR
jgi:hypothetical protein